MKVSSVAAAALISSVGAAPLETRTFLETDALAAEGVFNLGLYVALNGYPNGKSCNLGNVAIRREWYVQFTHAYASVTNVNKGRHFRQRRRNHTSRLFNAYQRSQQRLLLVLPLVRRIVMMTL